MSEKYYVDNLQFQQEEGDNVQLDIKDAEAVNEDGGELNNTIITYDSNTTSVSSWTDFINNFVNGTKVGQWFKNFKAGVEYILHVGSLVNNCVTDNANLPLSAAQGKVLMDEITQVKSDLTESISYEAYDISSDATIRNCYSLGNRATLTCSILYDSSSSVGDNIEICYIPESVRPSADQACLCVTSSIFYVYIVYSTGRVIIRPLSTISGSRTVNNKIWWDIN